MKLLEEAIIYSTVMYQGMERKINNTPFILHPLEVAQILSTLTDDQEIIAAGVLHDIVEDTDGTLSEIRKRFGDRVADIVDSETEKEFPDEDKASSWKKRKETSLAKLRNSREIGVKMLWLSDKLSNIRSLARSYGEHGEKTWEFLNQKDPAMHRWYYRTIAEYVEMDLNKTGAYKEFVDRINYIWPGTIDSWKAKYKEYRQVSVEGCKKLGSGAKADVYRYNEELIVKVYNEKNTYKDVEREISLARTAFVMGLPTAISFGIVSVGDRYGSMFELIDAKTFSELIGKNPENVDYYAGIMAELARQIHSTVPDNKVYFPNSSLMLESWVYRALDGDYQDLADRLTAMVRAIPDSETLIHGDFHTGNVFLAGGEPLFIDVDRMSRGNPIVDISNVYLFYIGYNVLDSTTIEKFMGFSSEVAERFYYSFLKAYLGRDDEETIRNITERAALISYVRMIGQLNKRTELSEHDKVKKATLIGKIRILLTKQSGLSLDI